MIRVIADLIFPWFLIYVWSKQQRGPKEHALLGPSYLDSAARSGKFNIPEEWTEPYDLNEMPLFADHISNRLRRQPAKAAL